MAKNSNQKLKLLYIMGALAEKSDENHRISVKQLIDELNLYGIKAERKSIYDDIESLRLWGMDILYSKEKPAGYFLAEREFQLPELKLLVDAVQASKFITAKKSNELIKKLESLVSIYEAKQLHRQVYVTNRIKTMNENIYYNVDKINEGIMANVKIKYKYFEWNIDKRMHPKRNGRAYIISPWALTWDDENYYMIGFDNKAGLIKHYRVDKMKSIELTKAPREGKDAMKDFDIAGFAKKTFGMFGGKNEAVTLRCENRLVGTIIDRFGDDVILCKEDDEHFSVTQEVTVSSQFYGWIMGLGSGVKITAPADVAGEFTQKLREILGNY